MRNSRILLTGLTLLLSAFVAIADDASIDRSKEIPGKSVAGLEEKGPADFVVIYYLHMNRRCMTCGKLEAFSREAIESGFAEKLQDRSIVWRVENFEKEANEHFAKNYKLYSQSLILSRLHDGKEIEWKNLDKIWKLVGNKEQFIAYVQSEVRDFLNSKEDE